MSVEKAKKFIEIVKGNPELQKQMSGFTVDELKKASTSMKDSGDLSESDLGGAAKSTIVYDCGFVVN